ncbi:hypothetical protein [Streptomyces sp. MAI_2237]
MKAGRTLRVFTTALVVALPGVWDRLRARDILFDFTMLQSGSGVDSVDGVCWTLWCELRFYLLFPAVVATGLTYRKVVVFCCAWGAAAMLAPVAHCGPLTWRRTPRTPGSSSRDSPST